MPPKYRRGFQRTPMGLVATGTAVMSRDYRSGKEATQRGSAAAEPREQPEDLDVQPHERDKQRERRVPLHVLRRARRDSALDEVEVEQEIERRDPDDEHVHADAQGAGPRDRLVQIRHVDSDKVEYERDEVHERDGARRRDDGDPKLVRDADEVRAVDEEKRHENADGERYRGNDDPGI